MNGAEVALRAVFYASAVVMFGASLFLVYAPADIPRSAVARMQRSGAGAALCSGVLWLVLRAAVVSGEPVLRVLSSETMLVVVRDTTFGRVSALRLALVVVFWAMPQRARIMRTALAGAVMASMAWSGHAIGTPGYVHVLSDAGHLLAASAWLGGLIPLAWALDRATGVDAAAALTSRFSTLGIVSVLALVVTGIVNAWFLVDRPGALFDTPYGRLLSLKLLVFASMLVLAAVNRVRLMPRMPESAAAVRQIARNARIEAGLGVVVLVIVAALGVMVPAAHMGAHAH